MTTMFTVFVSSLFSDLCSYKQFFGKSVNTETSDTNEEKLVANLASLLLAESVLLSCAHNGNVNKNIAVIAVRSSVIPNFFSNGPISVVSTDIYAL